MSDLIVPELRDFELCKCANDIFHQRPEIAEDGILFNCFNRAEADMIKRIMDDLYPKVPIYFAYLEFAQSASLWP